MGAATVPGLQSLERRHGEKMETAGGREGDPHSGGVGGVRIGSGASGAERAGGTGREGAAGFGPARPGQGAALPAGAQQVPERSRGRTAGGLTCAPRAGPGTAPCGPGGGRSAAGAASGRGFPRELSVPLPGGGRGRVL